MKHIIEVTTTLYQTDVLNVLNSARSTNDYANFIFPNGKYLMVAYHKDGTFDVSTNSRDQQLYRLRDFTIQSNSQNRVADFIVQAQDILARGMYRF